MLKSSGYDVHSFTKASEALEDIELKCRQHMSMIITDMRMPEYSGFEVARRARSVKPDVPVIFMTAFEINTSEFEKLFPSLKINEFLQKPFHMKKLLEVVRRYSDDLEWHV